MSSRRDSSPVHLKVVVIGGGTGNSTVLSGLKPWVGGGLTTIVNTFDDGGGTGKLRSEYEGLLAVGDLRQCLRALSDAPEEELSLLEHRFHGGLRAGPLGLDGQTLGNLIITAAGQMSGGNFADALSMVGRMYNIRGNVLPASHDSRCPKITLPDGRVILGEHEAEMTELPSFKGARVGFDKSPTTISKEAKGAIDAADMVVLAPGDLYTSLAPTLAVEGMREALEKANVVVLVCNLMNRSRHTAGYTALDYALEYERIIGAHVIDRILFNIGSLDVGSLEDQAREGSHPVRAKAAEIEKAGFVPIGKDLLSHEKVILNPHDKLAATRSTIRHDSQKVALALMGVYFNNGFGVKKVPSLYPLRRLLRRDHYG